MGTVVVVDYSTGNCIVTYMGYCIDSDTYRRSTCLLPVPSTTHSACIVPPCSYCRCVYLVHIFHTVVIMIHSNSTIVFTLTYL